MCGLVGILSPRRANLEAPHLCAMAKAISHRGPDDSQYWVDGSRGVALAFQRLSIVDLSIAGRQPMRSMGGRYTIVFNGEIYNHLEIRQQLHGLTSEVSWRGTSDTETLLAGFDRWGIEETLTKAVGMFALAIWDNSTGTLTLARDRIGEKPLYYGWQGDAFLFASELKAMQQHPAFEGSVSQQSAQLMLRFGYVPTPYSIYAGIYKVPPGQMLSLSLRDRSPVLKQYWSLVSAARKGVAGRMNMHQTVQTEIEALDQQLRTTIKDQMLADVPVGALLSGGVDSSTVVAIMQSLSKSPVKTFTIGFTERAYDESFAAYAIAKHLGTEHTTLVVSPTEALNTIPLLPQMFDEPFADSSQIPVYLVCKLAAQDVTVCLSGDGGDEAFGGYNRYRFMNRLWPIVKNVPMPLRTRLGKLLNGVNSKSWQALDSNSGGLLSKMVGVGLFSEKITKFADVISADSSWAAYQKLVTFFDTVDRSDFENMMPINQENFEGFNPVEKMMLFDTLQYLPDDILVKVDRASMANSLEVRAPFLDHRLIEFAWAIDPTSRISQSGKTKWITRQVLKKYVPEALWDRPKSGFGMPIDDWLRGPLRGWAEDLLSESSLKRAGHVDVNYIRQIWQEHLSGRKNWHHHLWVVLSLHAWQESVDR